MIEVLANVVVLMAGFLTVIASTSKALALTLPLVALIFRLTSHMATGYLPCELNALNGHTCLDAVTYERCRLLGIIRRPRYVRRSP